MREVGSEKREEGSERHSTRTRLEGSSGGSSAAVKIAAAKLRFFRETYHKKKSNQENIIVRLHLDRIPLINQTVV